MPDVATSVCPPAKFGTVLGYAPGQVPVHSSHYPSADPDELPDRHAYQSFVDGLYMGYKWQCVELARRWMYLTKGYVFEDITMAYDIFRLSQVRVVGDGRLLPLHAFCNGSPRLPEPGSLLVWGESGEFETTGHVAVVTEVFPDRLRIVEQNVENSVWPEGQSYSRELPVERGADGGYHVRCTHAGSTILGWVVQTADARLSEVIEPPNPRLFALRLDSMPDRGQARRPWLDPTQADEAAYVATNGHRLAVNDADQYRYFCLSETAYRELRRATNELHALFMHATGEVLEDDALLERFNVPRELWPPLRESWDSRRSHLVTGRFDYSVSERGIKLYEYNADSAGCHMECGKVQGRWAAHFGCERGRDAGGTLHERLVAAWREIPVGSLVHIMLDEDPEEEYHALYMKTALEAAGAACKLIRGMDGLAWDGQGRVVDGDGVVIERVWKTWAWETVLEQVRASADSPEPAPTPPAGRSQPPRLMDVLLQPQLAVHEPLWTVIPSNKAILPLLRELHPHHPCLLRSQLTLNPALRASGYVAKPIAGRCGFNVSMFDQDDRLLRETPGRFQHSELVYQELFPLPRVDRYHVQVSTFTVQGRYAGSCVRVDPSPVISSHSDLLALRIVDDVDHTPPDRDSGDGRRPRPRSASAARGSRRR